eukprot:12934443-Prorocentrum_lima.AAC.1
MTRPGVPKEMRISPAEAEDRRCLHAWRNAFDIGPAGGGRHATRARLLHDRWSMLGCAVGGVAKALVDL